MENLAHVDASVDLAAGALQVQPVVHGREETVARDLDVLLRPGQAQLEVVELLDAGGVACELEEGREV
jgi:hypothetical protein